MSVDTITFILFQLTIFALLVIQLIALTKEYALPVLQTQIQSLKKHFVDLRHKFSLTTKTKQHIQQKIQIEQESLKSLEANIKEWHSALASKEVRNKKNAAEFSTELQAKKQKQLSRLTLFKTQQAILPQAIADAKKILMAEYGKENAGKILLEKILLELGK